MKNQIANTILEQLGGSRFIAMVGAKNLLALDNGIQFGIGRNTEKITNVKIILDETDTYTMSFWKRRGVNCRMVKSQAWLYWDQLQDVFTRETGLYTHF